MDNNNSEVNLEITNSTVEETTGTVSDPLTQSNSDDPLLTILGTGNTDPMATLTLMTSGNQEGVSTGGNNESSEAGDDDTE